MPVTLTNVPKYAVVKVTMGGFVLANTDVGCLLEKSEGEALYSARCIAEGGDQTGAVVFALTPHTAIFPTVQQVYDILVEEG